MSATRATKKAASPATKPHEENRGKSVWVEAPDGSVGRRQPGWEDAPEPESAPAQVKPRITDRKKSSLVARCDCGVSVRVYLKGRGGIPGPFALGKTFTPVDHGSWTCEGCGSTNKATVA